MVTITRKIPHYNDNGAVTSTFSTQRYRPNPFKASCFIFLLR
jgi:hypothetical protein